MRSLVLFPIGVLTSSSVFVHAFPRARSMNTRSHPSLLLSRHPLLPSFARNFHDDEIDPFPPYQNWDGPQSRRAMINTLVSTFVGVSVVTKNVGPVRAYEKTFPSNLDFENGDTSKDIAALREAKIAQQKAENRKSAVWGPKDALTSITWGGALWLLLGSRSNPLVTPLANILYDRDEEQWLKDRNEGLFASVPPLLFVVLAVVFFALGVILDHLILLATQSDANVSLQLAGVTLIFGATLELGRVFSGEKRKTRQDFDRDSQLEREFTEFAEKRLMPGGNCHRSEVVKAFRRYYGKVSRNRDHTLPTRVFFPLTIVSIFALAVSTGGQSRLPPF